MRTSETVQMIAAAVLGLVATAGAQLSVVNGNFSDLSGLADHGGGWYFGVPVGWGSTAVNPGYTVQSATGATPPTANLQSLSVLSQGVGTLTNTCDVVLTFDFSQPWNAAAVSLSARILADSAVIAAGTFGSPASGLTLVATNVPSGSNISVQFVNEIPSGAPGLDNVAVGAFAIDSPPQIIRQPQAYAAMPAGTVATLSVSALGGVPPLGYQWQLNGVALEGATHTTQTVSAPGSYTVVVTAPNALSVTSTVAQVIGSVVNGDFSDLTGLSDQGGGWYSGLPAGWTSSEYPYGNFYAVATTYGPTPPVCNPSTLRFLEQKVGTLINISDVVLTVDAPNAFNQPGAILGVAILGTDTSPLAVGLFHPGLGHTLVASGVPAGTALTIQFWDDTSTPGLDNVAVSVLATNAPPQITRQPEASSALPEAMGMTLSVAVSGVPPRYQWRVNEVALAGETNAALTVTGPGSYTVVVTTPNTLSVTSTVAQVTQTNVLPLLNGDFTSDHLTSGWNSDWSRLGPPSATSGWGGCLSDGALNHDRFGIWTAFLSAFSPSYDLKRTLIAPAKVRVDFKAGYADQGGQTVYVDLIVNGTPNTQSVTIGQTLGSYTAIFKTEQQKGAVTLRFRGAGNFLTDVGSVIVERFRPGLILSIQ